MQSRWSDWRSLRKRPTQRTCETRYSRSGAHTLGQVRTVVVEQWLRDLQLASRTKVHIRNVMHVLFECAARWEFTQTNPITRVRQGGSRQSDPDILNPGRVSRFAESNHRYPSADNCDSGRMPRTQQERTHWIAVGKLRLDGCSIDRPMRSRKQPDWGTQRHWQDRGQCL